MWRTIDRPRPVPPAHATASSVNSVEAFKYTVQILTRNPDSAVADLDFNVTVGLSDGNRDRPTTGIGELDCVVQQIEHRRGELTTVTTHQEILIRQLDFNRDIILCRCRPNPIMGTR